MVDVRPLKARHNRQEPFVHDSLGGDDVAPVPAAPAPRIATPGGSQCVRPNWRDGYPFTALVGSFTANAFGLYELIGNGWDWTEDRFYGDYAPATFEAASRSAEACSTREVRGGNWFSSELRSRGR